MGEKRGPGWKALLAAWVPFLAFGFYLFIFGPYAKLRRITGFTGLPEERFGFSGRELYEFLGGLESALLGTYSTFQFFDLLNAAFTAMAFALLIWALAVYLSNRRLPLFLVGLPLLTGLFDQIENLLIIYVVRHLPEKYYGVAEAAGTVTMFKMSTGILGAFAIAVLGFVSIVKAAKRRRGRSNES